MRGPQSLGPAREGPVLLLDLDGTLVDPARGVTGSIRTAMAAMGRPVSDTDLGWVIGPPLRQSFATLLGGPERVEEAVALYRAAFAETGIFDADPYDGIMTVLEQLSATHRLCLCTAKPLPFARRIVDHFGFAPFFCGLYGAELDGRFDDKGDLIAHILGAEGLDPGRVIMIGDRANDTEAARKNGGRSIGVLWGYGGADELTGGGATRLCASPADLFACVAALDAVAEAR